MFNTGGPVNSILRHGRFYLRHNTPKRMLNLSRTAGAFVTRPVHASNMPITIKLESSAMCQLACPGCLQSDPEFKARAQGKTMDLDLFSALLDQAGDYLYRIQFYYNGEPFINTHLLEMVSATTHRNIGSQVSTNFSFPFKDHFYREIVESGLEHLIISMDGVDQDTYSQYRVNGKYDLVEHGMREIVEWKRKLKKKYPIVEWQFIIFEHNKHQIEQAQNLAADIGVDRLCLKYDGYSEPDTWNAQDQHTDTFLRRFRLDACLWLWGSLVVDWDGSVNPCCNGASHMSVGNLHDTALADIWNSNDMQELRAFVRQSPEQRSHPSNSGSPCYDCRFIM